MKQTILLVFFFLLFSSLIIADVGDLSGIRNLNMTGNLTINDTLFFDNSGKLGVNLLTPSYRLDVGGNARTYGFTVYYPSLIASDEDVYNGQEAMMNDHYLYIADRSSSKGLLIYNLTLKSHPHLLASYDIGTYGYDLRVYDGYVYMADYVYGLRIINATNITNPQVVGSDDPGYGLGIDFKHTATTNYVYLAAKTAGLVIYNVSDVTSPVVLGSYDTSGYAYDVEVNGNYAYVADETGGFKIIDVSNPSSPSLVGSYPSEDTQKVFIKDNYAYLADHADGLLILNISDPTSPTKIGNYNTSNGLVYDVFVVNNRAYITNATTGNNLLVLDVSDPANPQKIGETSVDAYNLWLDDQYIYAIGASLEIIDQNFYTVNVSNQLLYGKLGVRDPYPDAVLSVLGNAYIGDNGQGLVIDEDGALSDDDDSAVTINDGLNLKGDVYFSQENTAKIRGPWSCTGSGCSGLDFILQAADGDSGELASESGGDLFLSPGSGINGGSDGNLILGIDYGDYTGPFHLITPVGNVGVHTPNPSASLHVNGTFKVTSTSNVLGLYQASNAYVGIGTSSPGSPLTVEGNITSTKNISAEQYVIGKTGLCIGSDCRTSWASGTTTPGGSDGQIQFNNGGTLAGAAQFYYDDTNDRVGIGTMSPGSLLDVNGTINGKGLSIGEEDEWTPFYLIGGDKWLFNANTNGNLYIRHNDTATTYDDYYLIITHDGRIGLGSNSQYYLPGSEGDLTVGGGDLYLPNSDHIYDSSGDLYIDAGTGGDVVITIG